jgi:hypothetical protein
MKPEDAELDRITNELVRGYGIINVIKAVIGACDSSADFAYQCNDRRLEDYWRAAAVAIFDSIKRIGDLPEKSKKY